MALLQRHRLTGVRSSGTLFFFWLLMLLYGIVKLRTYILIEKYGVVSCNVSLEIMLTCKVLEDIGNILNDVDDTVYVQYLIT